MLRKGLRAVAVASALVAGMVGLPSAASAAGSGYFEIIAGNVNNDGFIRAYRNNGFTFANPGVEIGRGWFDTREIEFADINGDTWDDLIKLGSNGEVWAWPNNGHGQYNGMRRIAVGFLQSTTKFADIDGDGRDEIISFQETGNGEVWAWRNVDGFSNPNGPYSAGYQVIGTGWGDADWAWFADIDGDRKDEIIALKGDGVYGDLWAWKNVNGFGGAYTAGSVRIGIGWDNYDPVTIKFADLNNDQRYEVIYVPFYAGSVYAWRNVGGYVHDGTYTQPPVEVGQGWAAPTTFFAEVF